MSIISTVLPESFRVLIVADRGDCCKYFGIIAFGLLVCCKGPGFIAKHRVVCRKGFGKITGRQEAVRYLIYILILSMRFWGGDSFFL